MSAQGIWVGRHRGEPGRSVLLLQILQPHHLAWKRQIKCISATLLSMASHLLLFLFVGKFRFWKTEGAWDSTVPVQTLHRLKCCTNTDLHCHQTRPRMQPHLICGEGQTGELNRWFSIICWFGNHECPQATKQDRPSPSMSFLLYFFYINCIF